MLEDLANAWLNANCPMPKVRRDLVRELLGAERKGSNFSAAIGRNLTKSHKPYLVCGYAGELFVFELNQRQAGSLEAKDNTVTFHGFGRPELLRGPPPVVRLDDFHLDPISNRKDTDPISGECRYSVAAHLPIPYAAMAAYELGPSRFVASWCYPFDQLQAPGGVMRLQFPPIRFPDDPDATPWTGSTVIFVRLCLTVDSKSSEGRLPISNACAALLDAT